MFVLNYSLVDEKKKNTRRYFFFFFAFDIASHDWPLWKFS